MFYKKYKFPLNLFIVLEHTTPVIFTSEVLTPNHYTCLLDSKWYLTINLLLRKDIFFSNNYLSEISAADTRDYNNLFSELTTIFNNKLLLNNTYYFYNTKLRLTLFQSYSLENPRNLQSIDAIYKNANWLERELSEMFSPIYLNKTDTRMLLLDYPKDNNPMLKDFPVESWGELYYDFLDKSLHYTDVIDHTEL